MIWDRLGIYLQLKLRRQAALGITEASFVLLSLALSLQREIIKKEVSMFTGALIVFSLLVIFIAACLLPWWFIPVCIIATLINIFFFPHKY